MKTRFFLLLFTLLLALGSAALITLVQEAPINFSCVPDISDISNMPDFLREMPFTGSVLVAQRKSRRHRYIMTGIFGKLSSHIGDVVEPDHRGVGRYTTVMEYEQYKSRIKDIVHAASTNFHVPILPSGHQYYYMIFPHEGGFCETYYDNDTGQVFVWVLSTKKSLFADR